MPTIEAKVSKRGQPTHNPHGWVYRHPKWKELRAAFVARFGERCCDPYHVPGKSVGRIDLDHIKEIEDGGAPFDPNNLMLRCRSCHMTKTKAAQRKRFVLANMR